VYSGYLLSRGPVVGIQGPVSGVHIDRAKYLKIAIFPLILTLMYANRKERVISWRVNLA